MANLIPFTKRFESSENLVNLLESRGLQICDRNKAIQYLDNIGYYRLSAYMYPLLKMPKTAHLYKEGSTFKKVMMLYRFDKKLRPLMFNEIEKIEIAFRCAMMQITADMTGNPFWLTDSSYFLDSSKFNETMRAISKEYSKSKEEFILHFKRTYSEPYPPSWILGELLTIGNVNAIYRNINKIAYASVLPNVLGCLSMCLSHGSRLLLLLEMPVVIIQEYGTSRMLFSQQFPIVLQENG